MTHLAEIIVDPQIGDRVSVIYADGTQQTLVYRSLHEPTPPAWVVEGSDPLLVAVRRVGAIMIGARITFFGAGATNEKIASIEVLN